MDDLEERLNTLKKLMRLHDSYWHATAVHEIGPEKANRLKEADAMPSIPFQRQG